MAARIPSLPTPEALIPPYGTSPRARFSGLPVSPAMTRDTSSARSASRADTCASASARVCAGSAAAAYRMAYAAATAAST